jgi:hypothetical protein
MKRMNLLRDSGASATEAGFRRRARERKALAVPLAVQAIRDVEAIGFRAWIVGSLAKGRFSAFSDVDFAVDCPPEREYDAFRVIEKAMGAFPFTMIPYRRIQDDALPFVMEAAIDAPSLIAREAQA